jgi:hypothetical protein
LLELQFELELKSRHQQYYIKPLLLRFFDGTPARDHRHWCATRPHTASPAEDARCLSVNTKQ